MKNFQARRLVCDCMVLHTIKHCKTELSGFLSLKGKSLNAYETTCSDNSFNLSYEVPSDTNKKVFNFLIFQGQN